VRPNDARESARRKKAFGDALDTLLSPTAQEAADALGISPSALYALAHRSRPQMPSAGRLRDLALVCEAEAERLTLAARTLLQEASRADALRK
jgi:transcriptional regulator with XRE-family HTH domain